MTLRQTNHQRTHHIRYTSLTSTIIRHGRTIRTQAQPLLSRPNGSSLPRPRPKLTRQDQPLLRLPYELHRNNFKTAQRNIEQSQARVEELIRAALKNVAANPRETEASIDAATARLKTLRAKLQSLDRTQQTLSRQADARLQHVEDLHAVQSLADAGYERWSRTRLDRLLVDYMARSGFVRSAKQLVEDKGLGDLVDVDEFEAVGRIVHSLRSEHRVDLAMAWCGENKQNLRKLQQNTFEYELRMQQYIEMVRTGEPDKLLEATLHARKHLTAEGQSKMAIQSAGLLAFDANTDTEPFSVSSTTCSCPS
jgi:macrophage erythroblast attacher